MELNTQAFASSIQQDVTPKEKQENDCTRLSFVSDATRGTVTFVPTVPNDFNGLPYLRMYNVRETLVQTSQTKKQFGWSYILPKECYGKLTPEQEALYNEVVALWDRVTLDAEGNSVDWTYARSRSYTLMTGIVIDHINIAGTKVADSIDKPCVLCFPSQLVSKAVSEALQMEIQTSNGDVSVLNDIFNNNATGREAALAISFKKKGGNEIGYNCTVQVLFNSPRKKIIPADKDFGQANIDLTMNPYNTFLMWGYDEEHQQVFSELTFQEIKASLEKREKGEVYVPEQNAQPAQAPDLHTVAAAQEAAVDAPF